MPINFKPDLWRENEPSPRPAQRGEVSSYRWLATMVCTLTAAVFAGAASDVRIPNFAFPPISAAVREQAAMLGWPLDLNSGPASRTYPLVGDKVIALVTLENGESMRQWILQLAVSDLTEAERQIPTKLPSDVFTSTGNHLTFSSQHAAIAIRILGPWSWSNQHSSPTIKDVTDLTHRVVVNDSYLASGFDRAAAAMEIMRHLVAGSKRQRPPFEIGPSPFPAETVAEARSVATAGGLSEDSERAFISAQLALPEFLRVIVGTPGMADVLKSLVDVPWLSALTSAGKMEPKFNLLALYVQKLPFDATVASASQKYLVPFILRLNDKPAMVACMVVASPRPPIRTIAGVLGVEATAPDGSGPRLSLCVVGTRWAPDAIKAQVSAPAVR